MGVIPVIPSCAWYRFCRDVQCVRGRRVIVCVLPACLPLPEYLLIRVRGSLIVSISMRLDNFEFEVNAKVFIAVHFARI